MKTYTLWSVLFISGFAAGFYTGSLYAPSSSMRNEAPVKTDTSVASTAPVAVQTSAEPAAVVTVSKPYKVKVNYNLTLAQAVLAGAYDSENSLSDDSEKGRGKETLEVVLVDFGKNMYGADDKVNIGLAEQGLRALKLRELLAFGEQFPDVQLKYEIIGFGSAQLDGSRCFRIAPTLYSSTSRPAIGSFSEKEGGKRFFEFLFVDNMPGCSSYPQSSKPYVQKGITVFAATKAR